MRPFREFVTESTALDNIHRAIGSHWDYDVTHAPDYNRTHGAHGQGHGIKVVVKEPSKDVSAHEHRERIKKILAKDGHKVAHQGLVSEPRHQEFHLTVFHKK